MPKAGHFEQANALQCPPAVIIAEKRSKVQLYQSVRAILAFLGLSCGRQLIAG
jgi:hypothetical protein